MKTKQNVSDEAVQKKVVSFLKRLANSSFAYLMPRGNSAILYALRSMKSLGLLKVIIPDQGGWITYEEFPERLKLELLKLRTDSAQVNLKELEGMLKENQYSVLLLNSLAGYFIELPVKEIHKLCKKYNCVFINDVSGSIGTKLCDMEYSDIIVGSFGEDKPVNFGKAGFIAFNEKKYYYADIEDVKLDFQKLISCLDALSKRQKKLRECSRKIKDELKHLDVLNRYAPGINVVVRYKNDSEKQEILDYCAENKYEYTECPRYIRVLENAISIEVKRI